MSSGVAAKVMSSLWPVAASNLRPRSFRLAVIEPPASTFSSAPVAAIGGMAIARQSSAAVMKCLSIVVSRSGGRDYSVMAGLVPAMSEGWLWKLGLERTQAAHGVHQTGARFGLHHTGSRSVRTLDSLGAFHHRQY